MKINPTKIFTVVIIAFMPLAVYSSGISTLSFGDIALLFAFGLCVLSSFGQKQSNIFFPAMIMILYVLLNTLIMSENNSEYLRAIRFMFYLLSVGLFAGRFFDYEYGVETYRKISIFATSFLILQFILYRVFHYYLPGYLPFLSVSRDDLVAFSSKIYNSVDTAQRMRSIFQEPAHYATYVSTCIMLLLLDKEDRYIKTCIFLTIGVALSASATGLILTAACWVMFYLKKNKDGLNYKKILLAIGMLIAAFVFVLQSDSFRVVIARNSKNFFEMNRFSGYIEVWNLFQGKVSSILFGTGMNLYDEYLAGWSRMIYYFGLCGVLVYFLSFLLGVRKSKQSVFMICFLYVLGFGTATLLGGSSMLLLSFAVSKTHVESQIEVGVEEGIEEENDENP